MKERVIEKEWIVCVRVQWKKKLMREEKGGRRGNECDRMMMAVREPIKKKRINCVTAIVVFVKDWLQA